MPYFCDKNLEVILSKLQIYARKLLEWFSNNYAKMNSVLVTRQKGESQNGCFKNTKHAKFSEKRTFLTP